MMRPLAITTSLSTLAAASLFVLPNVAFAQVTPDPTANAGDRDTATNSDKTEQDIIVTGSRLGNTGFTAPTPVTVVSAETIQSRGAATLLEALNQTPLARPTQQTSGNARNSGGQNGIQGLVDLRGIGASRTLTLFDGQRFVSGGYLGVPDTNMFPSGLIKQVDIVTGGASAAYGSDAVAGVVNFVIRDRMDGLTASASTGISNYGDSAQFLASVAGGTSFAHDRAHLVFSYDHAENGGIGNIYERPYGALEVGLLGTGAVGSATRPAGTPASVWSNNVELATATLGGIVTTGPLRGTAFDTNGNPYAFRYGTIYGSSMTGSTANYGNNPQGYFNLGNRFNRNTGYAKLTVEATPGLDLWVSGNVGKVNEYSIGSGPASVSSTVIINISNPYIPAATRAAMVQAGQTNITVGKIFDVGGTSVEQHNNMWRIAGGAKGAIGGSWHWDGYFTHGETNEKYSILGELPADLYAASYAVRDASGAIVCGPVATNPNLATSATLRAQVQPGCVPFNIFGNTVDPAAKGYFFRSINAELQTRQDAGALNAHGTAFNNWAGPVSVAVGVEYRRESLASIVTDPLSLNNYYLSTSQANYSGSNTVKEAYGEIGVPLARGDGGILKALDLDVAGRVTDYRIGGTVVTWKAGLTYDVTDSLRLRATRSRDIRAPNLYDLFGINPPALMTGVVNRFNGQVGTAQAQSQGSTSLTPEVARTFTGGVVFAPKSGGLRGLRTSIDVYDIHLDKAIATVGVQPTIDGCFAGNQSYCSRIVFDTSTLGIALVSNSPSNLNTLHVQGIDFELDYRLKSPFSSTGSFDFHFLGSYLHKYDLTTPSGTLDYAGSAFAIGGTGTGGGSPRFRGSVTLAYDTQHLASQLRFDGFTNVIYNPGLLDPTQAGYNAAAATSISQNIFPGRIYVGWTETATIKISDSRQFQVFTVVNNLLNTQPPAYAINAFSFSEANYYDVVGRTYQVGVRVKL